MRRKVSHCARKGRGGRIAVAVGSGRPESAARKIRTRDWASLVKRCKRVFSTIVGGAASMIVTQLRVSVLYEQWNHLIVQGNYCV